MQLQEEIPGSNVLYKGGNVGSLLKMTENRAGTGAVTRAQGLDEKPKVFVRFLELLNLVLQSCVSPPQGCPSRFVRLSCVLALSSMGFTRGASRSLCIALLPVKKVVSTVDNRLK
jgi:hypothetical protein